MFHVKIHVDETKIRVSAATYQWTWDCESDIFSIFDAEKRLIGRGTQQPLVLTTQNQMGLSDRMPLFEVDGNRVSIHYDAVNGGSRLTVCWHFHDDFILLEPLRYESTTDEDIIQVVYFSERNGVTCKPSFYSRYAVVPGLCMSTNINPVVDLHSKLSVTTVLGSGAMRGPGFTQQWGLPAHYFCTFNTSDKWNAIGTKKLQSSAACWGLAALPHGDFRLEIREIGLSPVLNLRSDLWKQHPTPGVLELGSKWIIAFGAQFQEAIRNYYKILLRENVITHKIHSEKKNDVLLAPQYNTWGVESSKAMHPEELNEDIVRDVFDKLKRSGMKARTFVIDDKWEGRYGELRHDTARFPHFQSLLDEIRSQGFFIGLWAAFLRCQDPSMLGLNESHLLRAADGKPLWLSHGESRYGIFDVTQTAVQDVLRQRAREFIGAYRPDLIKFDFGYELPSLDVAAPFDMSYAGERLLQKGLDVIVGAMKEENPDLVIMYYGLSPLLIDYYDLHSPDDLVYCGGDYDLETNRRIFFSSICGELGMPTYGSSGYDWESALDIWFDSAPSGTLGSLHCFEGDENSHLPKPEWIAKYNGLAAILRKGTTFRVNPIGAKWQGGFRAAFAPSWERIEGDKTVLLALRPHQFDGKPADHPYKDILQTNVMLVVASLTDDEIWHAHRIGIVPFGNGTCTLRTIQHRKIKIVEHYFSGHQHITTVMQESPRIELILQPTCNQEILEWVEIVYTDEEEAG